MSQFIRVLNQSVVPHRQLENKYRRKSVNLVPKLLRIPHVPMDLADSYDESPYLRLSALAEKHRSCPEIFSVSRPRL